MWLPQSHSEASAPSSAAHRNTSWPVNEREEVRNSSSSERCPWDSSNPWEQEVTVIAWRTSWSDAPPTNSKANARTKEKKRSPLRYCCEKRIKTSSSSTHTQTHTVHTHPGVQQSNSPRLAATHTPEASAESEGALGRPPPYHRSPETLQLPSGGTTTPRPPRPISIAVCVPPCRYTGSGPRPPRSVKSIGQKIDRGRVKRGRVTAGSGGMCFAKTVHTKGLSVCRYLSLSLCISLYLSYPSIVGDRDPRPLHPSLDDLG